MAVDGGGRYHYLKTGAQMAQILDDELQHGRNVVASNVKLHLPRALASGLQVLGAPGQKDGGNPNKLVVDVGDLAAGEERHVLIKVDATVAADVGFAAPELLYTKAGESAQSLVAQRADYVFPIFIGTQLPVGLGGLVIASVIAAAVPTSALTDVSVDTSDRSSRPSPEGLNTLVVTAVPAPKLIGPLTFPPLRLSTPLVPGFSAILIPEGPAAWRVPPAPTTMLDTPPEILGSEVVLLMISVPARTSNDPPNEPPWL
jgi:hypothetical protein